MGRHNSTFSVIVLGPGYPRCKKKHSMGRGAPSRLHKHLNRMGYLVYLVDKARQNILKTNSILQDVLKNKLENLCVNQSRLYIPLPRNYIRRGRDRAPNRLSQDRSRRIYRQTSSVP